MTGENLATRTYPLKLFINDVLLRNNEVLVELNGNRASFIPYSILDIMHTHDVRFNEILFAKFYPLTPIDADQRLR